MMRCLAIAIILAMTAISAAAQAKPELLAAKLNREKAFIARTVGRERSEGRDRLTPARLSRAITVVDIDHDGLSDYMIDYHKVAHSSWCGTGGCDFELWRGTKEGNPRRIWNKMVREVKVSRRNGEIVFDFDFHGSNCGTFGAAACPASFAWDPRAGRMAERPTPSGDTTVRLIDPLPLTRAQVPANILEVSRAANEKCRIDGMSDGEYLPTSVPDIDGDKLRDWSLTIALCDTPGDFELEQILFATAGDASHPVRAASGVRYSLSFSSRPASVAQINATDACEVYSVEPGANICSRTPMVWNATAKKLETVAR